MSRRSTLPASALALTALAALIALFFWNPLAALFAFLTLLAGAIFSRLIFSQHDNPEAHKPDLETSTDKRLPQASGATGAEGVSTTALLDATMNSMREGMLMVDDSMRVVASNPAAHNIFAEGDGRIEARRLSDVTRNPHIHNAFRTALERGERAEVKVEVNGSDRRTFDLRVAPLRSGTGSEVHGALGIFFDITRLERLERVRQEFLSNVSHELRTPLTAIIAFVETLEEGAIDDGQNNRRFLSVIRKNATRMHNLIDDILELSAIEAGTVTVEPLPLRLYFLIEDVTTALASHAQSRNVILHNEVAQDAIVFAEARRLEQMLSNLVDNAIKFNREGGQVWIRHEAGASRDRISITDTGEGIPSEHLPRIFERFYRVDRARSREMGGTGLGLAIVKHLTRAHSGEATVQSEVGTGTTFTIELPKNDAEVGSQKEID